MTTQQLDTQTIEDYRENGFVRVRGIISPEEAARYHEAALEYAQKMAQAKAERGEKSNPIFDQLINVWRHEEALRPLTLHPAIASAATQLSGGPLRLWHDQLLVKWPGKSKATEFHQDKPYWPHDNSTRPISCWLALCDVPVERGCMTFIPRSQSLDNLPMQNLSDERSLFSVAPDLTWEERITVPLRAGDCTFHHGYCAHMATPNLTDVPRVAHVMIFIDRDTVFNGARHVVTTPLEMEAGQPLDGEHFPPVPVEA